MKNIAEYENSLKVILDDLRVCLEYTPHRENDLLCFMELYLKADASDRPHILAELRACMDDKEYPNPYLVYRQYGEEEIEQLEQLLIGYIADMKTAEDKELVLINLIVAINDLQDKCLGQLIDNWRKEHLIQLVVSVANECSYTMAGTVIDSKIRW